MSTINNELTSYIQKQYDIVNNELKRYGDNGGVEKFLSRLINYLYKIQDIHDEIRIAIYDTIHKKSETSSVFVDKLTFNKFLNLYKISHNLFKQVEIDCDLNYNDKMYIIHNNKFIKIKIDDYNSINVALKYKKSAFVDVDNNNEIKKLNVKQIEHEGIYLIFK